MLQVVYYITFYHCKRTEFVNNQVSVFQVLICQFLRDFLKEATGIN